MKEVSFQGSFEVGCGIRVTEGGGKIATFIENFVICTTTVQYNVFHSTMLLTAGGAFPAGRGCQAGRQDLGDRPERGAAQIERVPVQRARPCAQAVYRRVGSGAHHSQRLVSAGEKSVGMLCTSSVQLSSRWYIYIYTCLGRPICAPPSLSGISPTLSLKQFQCWSD